MAAAHDPQWSVAMTPADDVTAVAGHGLTGTRDGVELRHGDNRHTAATLSGEHQCKDTASAAPRVTTPTRSQVT